jgi:hypothetical protein
MKDSEHPMIFGDVPLKDAMIAWNPNRKGGIGDPGTILVIPYSSDQDWCNKLQLCYTSGACFTEWENLNNNKRLLQLMIIAWHIVCRDLISPEEVHNALSAIPEYRNTLTGETFFQNHP